MLKFIIIILLLYLFFYVKGDNKLEAYNTNIYSNHISRLNDINKLVRQGIYDIYKADPLIINWVINMIKNTNCNILVNDNIYYADPRVEFNYSHTIKDKIVLSDRDYNSLVKFYNTQDDLVLYNVGSTIVHESVHIHQRNNYDLYKKLYTLWGYIFVDNIKNIEPLLEVKRENPDAQDNNILWENENKFYFINCFYDTKKLDQYNVRYLAYEISREGNIFEYKGDEGLELDRFEEYTEYFGKLNNNYTPNEICAEYEEIFFMECLSRSYLFDSAAYFVYKNFLKK